MSRQRCCEEECLLLLLLTSSNCAQYTGGSNITVRAIHVRVDDTETKRVFSHTAAAAAAVAAQFVLLLLPNVVYSLEKFQSNLYTKRFATKKPPQLSSKIPYAPLPALNHTMPTIRWKSVLEMYPCIKQDKSATITIATVVVLVLRAQHERQIAKVADNGVRRKCM